MTNQKARGFTLIEIMVALAIGALLLAGITQVFISLKQTDKVSSALSRVQEAGRTAMGIMAYDFRMIGYKGCADPAITENINIIAANPPTTDFISTSLRGSDISATGWSSATTPVDFTDLSDIDGTGARKARLDSDIISIMRASDDTATVDEHDNNNSNVKVEGNPLNLSQGDVAILADCESMDIFRISNVTTSGGSSEVTFAHGMGSGVNTNNKLSKAYTDPNAKMMSFLSNTYFVGETGRKNVNGDTIYALFRRDISGNIQEIVEGVEDLQVTYGYEFVNGNRRFVDASTAAATLGAGGIELKMSQVTSIKFSILVASDDRVLDASDAAVYPMSGAKAEPASSGGSLTYPDDHRLRKVFTMTVNLRNRRVSI